MAIPHKQLQKVNTSWKNLAMHTESINVRLNA